MIDLYYWPTPNGRKVSILLEELEVPYKVIRIDIGKDQQFNTDFTKISPSNKIPAIVDHETNQHIFESGIILIYLAKKYKRFLSKKYYWETLEWLMFQMSQVGPFLGQAHQFLHYNPGKSQFVEDKYIKYAKRIYQTLDNRLSKRKYIAFEYSIADIAIWPWIARFEIHKIDINDYTNVLRWYKTIVSRAAVVKGYNVENDNDPIPLS